MRALLNVAIALPLVWAITLTAPALAQTFSSGSSGADGAFTPTTNTTLTLPANGVFNFTTISIPSGVIVRFTRNAANTPVTLLSTASVTIAGTENDARRLSTRNATDRSRMMFISFRFDTGVTHYGPVGPRLAVVVKDPLPKTRSRDGTSAQGRCRMRAQ